MGLRVGARVLDRRTARAPRILRCSKAEVADFVKENGCVASWLRKYACGPDGGLSGSRLSRARVLCRFFKWLRLEEEIFLSPSELLKVQAKKRKSDDPVERQWLLNLVLAHSRDNPQFADYSDMRRVDIFQMVKSFFDRYEVPLTIAKNVYGRRRKKKNHRKQIMLGEAKKVLGFLSQRDRTVLFIQLQSGMGLGEVLNKFNYMWHSQVKPQLDAGYQRLKIEFDERKGNGTWYFTYISRDAIHELRKWLRERERIVQSLVAEGKEVSKDVVEGEPIFITSRGNKIWQQSFCRQLKEKSGGRVTSHMFRKLFESEAKVPDRGIGLEYVKFFMGHVPQMDEAGGIYDRNVEIREEIFEKEYAKIERFINIYSSSVASRRTDPLLEDIEQLSQLPGGREFFSSIVDDAKTKLAEMLKKQK